jgi:hypothetical protein
LTKEIERFTDTIVCPTPSSLYPKKPCLFEDLKMPGDSGLNHQKRGLDITYAHLLITIDKLENRDTCLIIYSSDSFKKNIHRNTSSLLILIV